MGHALYWAPYAMVYCNLSTFIAYFILRLSKYETYAAMTTLLVLYPELFACRPKFERKMLKIVSNLDAFTVLYTSDARGFIRDLFSDDKRVKAVQHIECIEHHAITHAVIFDDGEVFSSAQVWLARQHIPTRYIHIAITRVINIKKEPEYQTLKHSDIYEYIGRGSYWGNPYSMLEEGTDREDVIRKFKYDFDFDKFPNKEKNEVFKLAGKRLGCFCQPAACHGDVLAEFLNQYDDGQ